MIFPKITTLSNKADKDFFIEKCQILTRLTECYAEKNGVAYPVCDSIDDALDVLTEFGIISNSDEIRGHCQTSVDEFFRFSQKCVTGGT